MQKKQGFPVENDKKKSEKGWVSWKEKKNTKCRIFRIEFSAEIEIEK